MVFAKLFLCILGSSIPVLARDCLIAGNRTLHKLGEDKKLKKKIKIQGYLTESKGRNAAGSHEGQEFVTCKLQMYLM